MKKWSDIKSSGYYALLVVQPNFLTTNTVQIISESNVPFDLKNQIRYRIKDVVEKSGTGNNRNCNSI